MEREFKILQFVFWLFIPVPFFHTRQFFWYGTHWMILCLVGWVTTEHLEKTSKFLFTWPTVTLITSKALWGTYLCCECCKLLTTVLRNSQVMWTLISYCDDCLMPILLLAVSHVSTIIDTRCTKKIILFVIFSVNISFLFFFSQQFKPYSTRDCSKTFQVHFTNKQFYAKAHSVLKLLLAMAQKSNKL